MAPYAPDCTTGRVRPAGQPLTGIWWANAWWVCPEKIASTLPSTPETIVPKAEPSVESARSADAGPSCTRSTITSASPLDSSPSDSASATALTELTIGATVNVEMPAGLTSSGSCSVTAPMKPTRMPSTVSMSYVG